MSKTIQTYSADGRRLRNYSVEAVDRLVSLDKLVVRRNKNNRITCAQFRETDGANPLRANAHRGTKYSFQKHFGAQRCWVHRDLIPRQDAERLLGLETEPEETLDLCVRAIFRAVPLSVLRWAA